MNKRIRKKIVKRGERIATQDFRDSLRPQADGKTFAAHVEWLTIEDPATGNVVNLGPGRIELTHVVQ